MVHRGAGLGAAFCRAGPVLVPAWTRITEPDGAPGEWYLHLFAPEQPDFNWANTDVRQEFDDVLRFWFDRGADGIRIDSAALLTKDPQLPDVAPESRPDPRIPMLTAMTCTIFINHGGHWRMSTRAGC